MACRPFYVSLILTIVYNDNKYYVYNAVVRYHTRSINIISNVLCIRVRAREGTKRATRLDLVCRHGGKR